MVDEGNRGSPHAGSGMPHPGRDMGYRRPVHPQTVYLYDHSGIAVSTSPFSCPWDSGFFGIIAVPLDKIRKEYGWKHITASRRKRIERYLQNEIKTLDDYYTGKVFGYRITSEDEASNELDSCWGFYGTDSLKEMEDECRHIIDGLNKAA